jgi:cytochrome P450 family 142 subfamily A polypeptide 1
MLLATTVGDDAALEAAMMAAIEFREFQLDVIADRRAAGPTDDLIGVLCHAEIDGERLDDESLIMESLLILIGGDETSRHVIADGMTALLEHPDQLALLQAEPDRMTVAVEELLRWVSPIKNMGRTVTTDTELAGQRLEAGDQLMVIYPSANRDAEVFDEPDRFDITRQPNPHVAFGFGPHFCLGASLARLELSILFTQVLERMGDLTLATEPGPRRASNFISGPEHMPVRFTPSAPVGLVN